METIPDNNSVPGQRIVSESSSDIAVRSLSAVVGLRGPLLVLADLLSITGSFLFSYYLRFHVQFLAIKHAPAGNVEAYIRGAILLAGIWCFLLWRRGAYAVGLFRDFSRMLSLRHVVGTGMEAVAALMVISYLYRGLFLSRQVYLMTGAFAVFAMIVVRSLARALDQEATERGAVSARLVVVGTPDRAHRVVRQLMAHRTSLELVGFVQCGDDGDRERLNAEIDKAVLGTVSELDAIYEKTPFDCVLVCQHSTGGHDDRQFENQVIELMNFCEAKDIEVYTVPHHFTVAIREAEVGQFCGMPLVQLQDASQHPAYAVVKRLIDVVVSLSVVIFGLPFWVIVPILIKLEDGGPVLFAQTRVGLHGRHFRMYKFRSMVVDAEDRLKDLVDIDRLDVPGFKLRNDPRVTRIGRFLRRTSLDELPQIFNILRGEMSIVGPRPELPLLVDRYSPAQRRRLKARPGLTGYMQIHRRGAPLADEESINLDLIYLKQQSLLFDFSIMLRTAWVVICGKGVTY